MKASSYNFMPDTPILRLDLLEGQVLRLMAESASGKERARLQNESDKAYSSAKIVAEQQGALSKLWRIHREMAQLYRQMDRNEAAQVESGKAQSIIHNLAEKIGDKELKEVFLKHAA